MQTFSDWLIRETTTWGDVFKKNAKISRVFGKLQNSDSLQPYVPTLKGWKVRFKPTGEEFRVIGADEKSVRLDKDFDHYHKNRIPLGDGFVWGDWEFISPDGKTVSLRRHSV